MLIRPPRTTVVSQTHQAATQLCCCSCPLSIPLKCSGQKQLLIRPLSLSITASSVNKRVAPRQSRKPNLLEALLQRPGILFATAAAGSVGLIALIAKLGGGGNSGGGKHKSGGGGGRDGQGPSDHAAGVAGRDDEDKPKLPLVSLTLVSFAVTRKAYHLITERFVKDYQAATGQQVKFRLSFGGSGTQARALVDGLPGDVVALALPLDVQKIADAGLIDGNWRERLPNGAVVAESVVALVTRKGNPKNIRGWDDLIREDVSVITANPKTAGVARWNFLALWGHRSKKGDAAALDYVTKVFENVPVQPRDAREASDVFYKQNLGDVLLNYENEVRLTNLSYKENALPYIVPDNNVCIETPVAVVDKNVKQRSSRTRDATVEAAHAFTQYLFTPACQEHFSDSGFRSIDPKLRKASKLPKVKDVWKVEDRLGSWAEVQQRFFGAGGVLDDIQRHVGEKRRREREGK
ncbi:hypothetical protein WJX73_002563 [Symbiochloris irregularis]|uniref:Sulfate-binding protein n=1 Tax=Symbiochloris irregularis TaxID=706552 RepID=A0AAW1PGD2_9CHLO